jgi:Mg-chelatase subunit ChlD
MKWFHSITKEKASMSQTHLTLVVDRSGSMEYIKFRAEEGIKNFVGKQKDETGTCSFLLTEFDNTIDTVYSGPIKKYGNEYKLQPRGGTALRDAIAEGILNTEKIITKTSLRYRPKLVICCIVTDGQENQSRVYSDEQVKKMIAEKQEQGWQFVYLCADYAAQRYGQQLGIANVAQYGVAKTVQTYEATNSLVSRMRSDSCEGREIRNSFTARETSEIQ